mgnify:CR=1 FL=1
MYCSAREFKEKRRPSNSGIYLTPVAKVVASRWEDSDGTFRVRYCVALDGRDEVEREPKTKWTLTLSQSERVDGKIKKRQHHVATLSYWQFVTNYLRELTFERFDMDHILPVAGTARSWLDAPLVDELVRAGVKAHFPLQKIDTQGMTAAKKRAADVEQAKLNDAHAAILSTVMDKVADIKASVVADYRESREFKAFNACLDVLAKPLDDLVQEEAAARTATRRDERARKQQRFEDARQQAQQFWSDGGNTSSSKRMTEEQIKTAFHKLAMAVHPDRGGDADAMAALNALKDELLTK